MASNSKSQLRVTDRISDLPDSLLCHILSFIPTKYSVSTSSLSTRWKRVWASVPCLEFYDGLFPDFESFVLYFTFVTHQTFKSSNLNATMLSVSFILMVGFALPLCIILLNLIFVLKKMDHIQRTSVSSCLRAFSCAKHCLF
ncbi:putative F-box domain-containing protein [Rosa chinensis]|uniref:Putative F-box domain-containing protein n=1 Tax=Rosa chinensis TaxID=74649 RepID=A0A2P6PH61_ROSCH|nr:putative F-box domain-containing protein [Rosa chinensis]